MSTLWNVAVERLEDREALLRVVRVHPDAGPFADDAPFALRMLHEALIAADGPAPLGEAVNEDYALSERWQSANAGRFVEDVSVEEEDGDTAAYRIRVTDPQWIAHLRPGLHWHSAAFS
jgi:hypothetical protein